MNGKTVYAIVLGVPAEPVRIKSLAGDKVGAVTLLGSGAKLDWEQDASAIQDLLETLPPNYRTPVVLRYWYDMSYREIADTMGVTESTIKTRLHRARTKLARHVSSTAQGIAYRHNSQEDQTVVESVA